MESEESRSAEHIAKSHLKTWLIVVETHHRVCAAFASSLKELDLTSAQHELLANLLVAEGGLTQNQLAELLLVTKGNITGLVKRLEKRELVQRESDPDDRRKNNVTLTKEGARLAKLSLAKQQELVDGVFGELSMQDEKQLREYMKLLEVGTKKYSKSTGFS